MQKVDKHIKDVFPEYSRTAVLSFAIAHLDEFILNDLDNTIASKHIHLCLSPLWYVQK